MYVGFVLTGMGTVLLGCILPTLIARWHLDDGRAGSLFAVQFAGSALGAGLVTDHYFNSIVRGYGLLTASARIKVTRLRVVESVAGMSQTRSSIVPNFGRGRMSQ